MIKVKASDMAGLSSHQFQQAGNFAADQKELQKVLMKLKAEKKTQDSIGLTAESTIAAPAKSTRSKSKIRGSDVNGGECDNDPYRRSRSTGRRSSDPDIVDLTAERRTKSVSRRISGSDAEIVDLSKDKRCQSVSRRSSEKTNTEKRRSRSAARAPMSDNGEAKDVALKSDKTKEQRNRGRSVGAKTSSDRSGGKVRDVSLARNGKERERSRSVARQRICDEIEGTSKEFMEERHRSGQSTKSSGTVDLASGLANVDRDTRSRSVARKRPGEEETEDSVNHSSMPQRHSSTRSKGSIKSDDSEKRRSKSVGRKSMEKGENTSELHQDRTISSREMDGEDIGSKKSAQFHDLATTGKSIPWNEFLKHAQSVKP
jgi:hypothetical protein